MSKSLLLVALAVVHILWGGGFIVLKMAQEFFTIEQILLGRVLFASLLYLVLWSRIPKLRTRKATGKCSCFSPCVNLSCSSPLRHWDCNTPLLHRAE